MRGALAAIAGGKDRGARSKRAATTFDAGGAEASIGPAAAGRRYGIGRAQRPTHHVAPLLLCRVDAAVFRVIRVRAVLGCTRARSAFPLRALPLYGLCPCAPLFGLNLATLYLKKSTPKKKVTKSKKKVMGGRLQDSCFALTTCCLLMGF